MPSLTVPVPVVEVLGARKTYHRAAAAVPGLEQVDLFVFRGEYLAIVGASGSGKFVRACF